MFWNYGWRIRLREFGAGADAYCLPVNMDMVPWSFGTWDSKIWRGPDRLYFLTSHVAYTNPPSHNLSLLFDTHLAPEPLREA